MLCSRCFVAIRSSAYPTLRYHSTQLVCVYYRQAYRVKPVCFSITKAFKVLPAVLRSFSKQTGQCIVLISCFWSVRTVRISRQTGEPWEISRKDCRQLPAVLRIFAGFWETLLKHVKQKGVRSWIHAFVPPHRSLSIAQTIYVASTSIFTKVPVACHFESFRKRFWTSNSWLTHAQLTERIIRTSQRALFRSLTVTDE